MRRILCVLFGHPDSAIHWGAWQYARQVGRFRVVTEECTRCRGVLALSSILESEWWPT